MAQAQYLKDSHVGADACLMLFLCIFYSFYTPFNCQGLLDSWIKLNYQNASVLSLFLHSIILYLSLRALLHILAYCSARVK